MRLCQEVGQDERSPLRNDRTGFFVGDRLSIFEHLEDRGGWCVRCVGVYVCMLCRATCECFSCALISCATETSPHHAANADFHVQDQSSFCGSKSCSQKFWRSRTVSSQCPFYTERCLASWTITVLRTCSSTFPIYSSLAALTHCTSIAERFTIQPKNKDRLEII